MMRRLLWGLVAAGLVLAACGSDDDAPVDDATEAEDTDTSAPDDAPDDDGETGVDEPEAGGDDGDLDVDALFDLVGTGTLTVGAFTSEVQGDCAIGPTFPGSEPTDDLLAWDEFEVLAGVDNSELDPDPNMGIVLLGNAERFTRMEIQVEEADGRVTSRPTMLVEATVLERLDAPEYVGSVIKARLVSNEADDGQSFEAELYCSVGEVE